MNTSPREIDRRHIWHPFTQMKDYAACDPPCITRGTGIMLYDDEGNGYFDTISSWWTNLLGHANEELADAIGEQARTLAHVNFSGFTHPYAIGLVQRLMRLLPPTLTRAFFSDDGSTAVEVALKMAFQYWQNRGDGKKTRFAMLGDAYHGDTLGAVSVGGVELYHQLYAPLMFSTFKVDPPHCTTCPHRTSEFTRDARDTGCSLECVAAMENTVSAHADELAAVIVEPLLQGAGGMHVYPPAYLERLRALCDAHNVLLIFDEVATGFGRTGRMFAMEYTDIAPDIVCLSKSITGGTMPIALTVATDDIYTAFYDDWSALKTFFHGHSYTANPLACAVACATLDILERENMPASRAGVIAHFHDALDGLAANAWVGDIRYLGFVGAVDIVLDRAARTPLPEGARLSWSLHRAGLRHGLVLRPLGNMVYFFLPMTVTCEEIDEITRRFTDAVTDALDEID